MKTSEALYAAADYIRAHGWRRGAFGKHGEPRCMIGAVVSASGRSLCETLADDAIFGALIDVCNMRPSDFNDIHCRTRKDAIAALEIAADIASAEGR